MPRAYKAILRGALVGWDGRGPLAALDYGVGTGALSLALARVAPGPLTVDGVDVAPAMLRGAETALARHDVSFRAHRADLRSRPKDHVRFDLAVAAHMIEHLPDPRAALREMVRVTRPGGHVVLCATRNTARGLLIQLRWRTHRLAPETLAGWMRAAGLQEVRQLRPVAGASTRAAAPGWAPSRPAIPPRLKGFFTNGVQVARTQGDPPMALSLAFLGTTMIVLLPICLPLRRPHQVRAKG
ncbi:MAG: class I SAM-dependent methyltransferase [Pseudomonadota bacterium]